MKVRGASAAAALAIFGVVAGFVGHQLNAHPKVQHVLVEGEIEASHYLRRLGISCGVEAWDVKTLQDSAASSVNLTPVRTNIPTLIQLGGPSGQRLQPATTWLLSGARLSAFKLEPDSDIHLVLRSTLGAHPTMIAEIPSPGCAPNSVALAQITAARSAFEAQVGPPATSFTQTDVPVTLAGVGFTDFAHNQTGADPNQTELHPVIFFKRLK